MEVTHYPEVEYWLRRMLEFNELEFNQYEKYQLIRVADMDALAKLIIKKLNGAGI